MTGRAVISEAAVAVSSTLFLAFSMVGCRFVLGLFLDDALSTILGAVGGIYLGLPVVEEISPCIRWLMLRR